MQQQLHWNINHSKHSGNYMHQLIQIDTAKSAKQNKGDLLLHKATIFDPTEGYFSFL
jgi:hypothetical protein